MAKERTVSTSNAAESVPRATGKRRWTQPFAIQRRLKTALDRHKANGRSFLDMANASKLVEGHEPDFSEASINTNRSQDRFDNLGSLEEKPMLLHRQTSCPLISEVQSRIFLSPIASTARRPSSLKVDHTQARILWWYEQRLKMTSSWRFSLQRNLSHVTRDVSVCLLSSPKMIIDSARRTLFISKRSFRDHDKPPVLSLSLTLQEDLNILTHVCGNSRYDIQMCGTRTKR